jgi:hypothetical protein
MIIIIIAILICSIYFNYRYVRYKKNKREMDEIVNKIINKREEDKEWASEIINKLKDKMK